MPRASQFLLIERRGNSERPLYTANDLEEMAEFINTKTGRPAPEPDPIGFDLEELQLFDDNDGGLL